MAHWHHDGSGRNLNAPPGSPHGSPGAAGPTVTVTFSEVPLTSWRALAAYDASERAHCGTGRLTTTESTTVSSLSLRVLENKGGLLLVVRPRASAPPARRLPTWPAASARPECTKYTQWHTPQPGAASVRAPRAAALARAATGPSRHHDSFERGPPEVQAGRGGRRVARYWRHERRIRVFNDAYTAPHSCALAVSYTPSRLSRRE
jgi:hypothetical protein